MHHVAGRGRLHTVSTIRKALVSKHLTPDEVADAIGMRPDRLVGFCIRQFIPVCEGRVDTTRVLTRREGCGARSPGSTEDLLAA